jgi:hypothetical protein
MKNKILGKILVICVIILFVGVFVVPSISGNNIINSENIIKPQPARDVLFNDELDQSQTECYLGFPLGWGYYGYDSGPCAQSFTPQKNIMTRVFLYVGKVGSPDIFHFAIREELDGVDLVTVSKDQSQFPYWNNPQWIEFNFDDIPVIAGEKYYMICSTQPKTNTFYEVWFGINDPYPYGTAFAKIDGGPWEEDIYVDLSFKTYGIGGPPNKPSTPSGPVNGVVGTSYNYSSFTSDPDGDQIFYLFDWGDGTDSGWIGPFNSGDTGSAGHKWNFKGTYNIKVKAKDTYNAESVWSNPLSVTIPRNKQIINRPFLNCLKSHPNMLPLLQKLLISL